MGYVKSVKPVSDYLYECSTENRAFDWNQVLIDAGYFKVEVGSNRQLYEVHRWCQENVPGPHYVWLNKNFYFTRHHDAMMFALRWL